MSLIHRKPPSFVIEMSLSADDNAEMVAECHPEPPYESWIEEGVKVVRPLDSRPRLASAGPRTLQHLTHYFRGSFAPEDRPEALAERFVGKVARDPGDRRVVVVDHIRLTVWERFFLPARYEAEVSARIVATPGDAS